MTDITTIPLQELLDDKAASLADIKVCELALLHDIITYGDGDSVQRRLYVNKKIVAVIEAELQRREGENERDNAGRGGE